MQSENDMAKSQTLTIDGNQAAAEIAHMTNEVVAIYPITPASPMGEGADEWSSRDRPNLWGTVPRIIEMQSELSPSVFHVSARTVATHALSIFGDHSDVMAARTTGFAFIASGCPQEVLDMALITQAATLESRIPIVHFFDGFRTSHEVAKIQSIDTEVIRQLIKQQHVTAHRQRA